mmetsp:Transcript_6779/g.9977  ORF Transcript_6779/g.9977 Transcript_6779/m.9977 type:complete len:264 (-) Transcript_6779:110-901(-)
MYYTKNMIKPISSLAIFFSTLTAPIKAFSPVPTAFTASSSLSSATSTSGLYQNSIHKVPEDDDTPIAFIDPSNSAFVECYADSIAIVNGVEYTIGNPCDTSVALCFFDKSDNLVPIDLDSSMMDEVFPLAASIVEDEFGEELALERTPQTLTLVGELEDGEEDEDELDEDADEGTDEESEEVEILLSFEEEGVEYCLVRLLDPVLLVGKNAEGTAAAATTGNGNGIDQKCYLLTPEESDKIMPAVERMFLEIQEETDKSSSSS